MGETTRHATARGGRRRRDAGAILVGALLLALFAGRLWRLPARFSLDPNEGWNAILGRRAFGSTPLYPAPGDLLANNYPPASFYLGGVLDRVFGDAIVAGRILSVLALLTVAAEISLVARRFGRGGGVATMLLLGFAGTLLRPYLAMNDPQWLAHAVQTAALCLLVPRRATDAPSRRHAAGAALLVVVGGLIKHNLVALPLAITLWLARYYRRAAIAWIGTGLAAAALATLAAVAFYGPAMVPDVLAAPRYFSLFRAAAQGWPLLACAAPMLAALGPLRDARRADPRFDLLLLFLAAALPIGLVEQGGQGVDVNAGIEAVIALSLAGGVAWALRPALMRGALLALPLLVLLPGALRDSVAEIETRSREEAAWAQVQHRIDATPGPIACAMPAFCYWSGRDMGVDPFLYGQQVIVSGDRTALDHALATRRFALVQLEPEGPPLLGERPDPLPAIVRRRYQTLFDDGSGRTLLVPR